MRVVTQSDIKEFNRLYLELKTYAAVARKTGFSPWDHRSCPRNSTPPTSGRSWSRSTISRVSAD